MYVPTLYDAFTECTLSSMPFARLFVISTEIIFQYSRLFPPFDFCLIQITAHGTRHRTPRLQWKMMCDRRLHWLQKWRRMTKCIKVIVSCRFFFFHSFPLTHLIDGNFYLTRRYFHQQSKRCRCHHFGPQYRRSSRSILSRRLNDHWHWLLNASILWKEKKLLGKLYIIFLLFPSFFFFILLFLCKKKCI